MLTEKNIKNRFGNKMCICIRCIFGVANFNQQPLEKAWALAPDRPGFKLQFCLLQARWPCPYCLPL